MSYAFRNISTGEIRIATAQYPDVYSFEVLRSLQLNPEIWVLI
jgi:hypothetical protein